MTLLLLRITQSLPSNGGFSDCFILSSLLLQYIHIYMHTHIHTEGVTRISIPYSVLLENPASVKISRIAFFPIAILLHVYYGYEGKVHLALKYFRAYIPYSWKKKMMLLNSPCRLEVRPVQELTAEGSTGSNQRSEYAVGVRWSSLCKWVRKQWNVLHWKPLPRNVW